VVVRRAVIRGRPGDPNHGRCCYCNRTCYGASSTARSATYTSGRAARLGHRVARKRREENHRYKLFHETPQMETTSLMVAAH
jgi:hypothetical protein